MTPPAIRRPRSEVAVSSVMRENVLTVAPEQKVALAVQMMLWGGVRHLPVVSEDRVIGLLSERDVLRAQRDGALDRPIAEFMSRPAHTARPDETIDAVAARMVSKGIGSVVVVDDGEVAGIVTTTDLLDFLARPAELAEGRAAPEARDVMSTMMLTFGPEDDVLDVLATMVREEVRHMPIVDEDRRLFGIVSDRDLRAAVGDPLVALRDRDVPPDQPWPIESVMTPAPLTVRPDAPLDEVARCFVDNAVGAVPVVDSEQRLIGIVSYVDLLRFAYRVGLG